MESESPLSPVDGRAALRAAERAAAAPYVDYPPTPWWYPPAGGAWATAFAATLLLLDDHHAWQAITRLLLVAVLGGFVGWSYRQRGTWPSMRGVPAEFRSAFTAYLAGVLVVLAVLLVAGLLAPSWVTLTLTFVLVTAGLAVYERRYARAARETRARLG